MKFTYFVSKATRLCLDFQTKSNIQAKKTLRSS